MTALYDEMMKEINRAYRLLKDYCEHYRYTFSEEDVNRAYPGESYRRRYVNGWFQGP